MVQKIIQDSDNSQLFYLDDINFSAKDPDIQRALFFERMRGVKEIQLQTKKVRELGVSNLHNFAFNHEVVAVEEEEAIPLSFLGRNPHVIFDDLDIDDENIWALRNSPVFLSLIHQLNELLAEDFFMFLSDSFDKGNGDEDFVQPVTMVTADQEKFFQVSGRTITFHPQTLQVFFDGEEDFEKDQRTYYAMLSFLLSLLGLDKFPALTFPLSDYFERKFSFDNLDKIDNELLVRKVISPSDLNEINFKINASVNFWRVTEVTLLTYFDQDTGSFLSEHELRHIREYYREDQSNEREYFFDCNGWHTDYIGAWDYNSLGYELQEVIEVGLEKRIVLKHKTQNMIGDQSINFSLIFETEKEDTATFPPFFYQANIRSRLVYDLVINEIRPETIAYELLEPSEFVEINGEKIIFHIENLFHSKNHELANADSLESEFDLELGEDKGIRLKAEYRRKNCQVDVIYYDADSAFEMMKKELLLGLAGEEIKFEPVVPENYELVSENSDLLETFEAEEQIIEVVMRPAHKLHFEEVIFKLQVEGVSSDLLEELSEELSVSARVSVDQNLLTGECEKGAEPEILELEAPTIRGYELKSPLDSLLLYDVSEGDYKSFTRTVQYQPIQGVIKLSFQDLDSEKRELVQQSELSGKYGDYPSVSDIEMPKGFEVVSGFEEGEVTFVEPYQELMLLVRHKIEKVKEVVTHTVKYESVEGELLDEVEQKIAFWILTDLATEEVSYEGLENFSAVQLPKIQGFKPVEGSPEEIAFKTESGKKPESQITSIVYERTIGKALIQCIDLDANRELISSPQLEGFSGEEIDIISIIPEKYSVENEEMPSYRFKDEEQEIEVELRHKLEKRTDFRAFEVELHGISEEHERITKVFEVEVTQDLVTGEIYQSPDQEEITIEAPEFQGYRLIQGQEKIISYKPFENECQDKLIVVNYERAIGKALVQYVDLDADRELVSSTELEGISGEEIDIIPTIPEKYILENEELSSYRFKDEDQEIEIELRHKLEKGTDLRTFEVELQGVSVEEDRISRVFEVEVTQDLVTGEIHQSSEQEEITIDLPNFQGYRLTQGQEEKASYQPASNGFAEKLLVVNYERAISKATVKYLDIDADQELISSVELEGISGEEIDLISTIPEKYELFDTDLEVYQFQEDGQEIEIELKHQFEKRTELRSFEVHLQGVSVDPNRITKVFEVEVWEDLVSGEIYQSSAQEEITIKVPEFQGYRLSENQGSLISYKPADNQFEDKLIIVNYERIESKVYVKYIDKDAQDTQVGELEEFTGTQGSPFFFELVPPENYQFFQVPNFEGSYFGEENQVFVVELEHICEKVERRLLIEIRLLGVPIKPDSFIKMIELEEYKDLVTGEVIHVSAKRKIEIKTPEIPGYHLKNPNETKIIIDPTKEISDNQIFIVEYEKNETGPKLPLSPNLTPKMKAGPTGQVEDIKIDLTEEILNLEEKGVEVLKEPLSDIEDTFSSEKHESDELAKNLGHALSSVKPELDLNLKEKPSDFDLNPVDQEKVPVKPEIKVDLKRNLNQSTKKVTVSASPKLKEVKEEAVDFEVDFSHIKPDVENLSRESRGELPNVPLTSDDAISSVKPKLDLNLKEKTSDFKLNPEGKEKFAVKPEIKLDLKKSPNQQATKKVSAPASSKLKEAKEEAVDFEVDFSHIKPDVEKLGPETRDEIPDVFLTSGDAVPSVKPELDLSLKEKPNDFNLNREGKEKFAVKPEIKLDMKQNSKKAGKKVSAPISPALKEIETLKEAKEEAVGFEVDFSHIKPELEVNIKEKALVLGKREEEKLDSLEKTSNTESLNPEGEEKVAEVFVDFEAYSSPVKPEVKLELEEKVDINESSREILTPIDAESEELDFLKKEKADFDIHLSHIKPEIDQKIDEKSKDHIQEENLIEKVPSSKADSSKEVKVTKKKKPALEQTMTSEEETDSTGLEPEHQVESEVQTLGQDLTKENQKQDSLEQASDVLEEASEFMDFDSHLSYLRPETDKSDDNENMYKANLLNNENLFDFEDNHKEWYGSDTSIDEEEEGKIRAENAPELIEKIRSELDLNNVNKAREEFEKNLDMLRIKPDRAKNKKKSEDSKDQNKKIREVGLDLKKKSYRSKH